MQDQNQCLIKAEYCLNCKNKPCQNGCPLQNDTAGFISLSKKMDFHGAYNLLSKTTIMPAICGRICPHSKQCQGSCIRGIKSEPVAIGEIESTIGDMSLKNGWQLFDKPPKRSLGVCVAVVGAGPAGLTAAAFLAKAGVRVTIYEKYSHLGGLLVHGIPDFRLDRKIIKDTIDKILALGIEVKLNQTLGKNITIKELEKNYDAVFLAFGANIHSKMNVDGETLKGVFGGNEFLEKPPKIDFHGKLAYVCGGGNVAMDVSRTLVRLGAKVFLVYRRSETEMPAEKKEILDAKKEGVKFLFQHNIVKIIGEKNVTGVELIKTELVHDPNSSRPVPVNIPESNYLLPADFVFMALGSQIEAEVAESLQVELDTRKKIVVNDKYQTSNPKIFAGGDLVSNKKTGSVAWASRHGRDAAVNILEFLKIL